MFKRIKRRIQRELMKRLAFVVQGVLFKAIIELNNKQIINDLQATAASQAVPSLMLRIYDDMEGIIEAVEEDLKNS